MKKIYTLFVGLIAAGSLLAQQTQAPLQTGSLGKHPMTPAQSAKINSFGAQKVAEYKHNKTATVHEYLSPHDAVYSIQGGSAAFSTYVDPIFPDSTVVVNFGTPANVTTMKAGGIFDGISNNYPNATPSQPSIIFAQPYTIDTVWVAGQYFAKNIASGDTLQVEVSWGPKASTWYASLQLPGPPVEKFRMPKNTTSTAAGNKSFSTAPAANSTILKHVFTIADTTSGGAYFALPCNLNIPAGSIVGIEYTFIPKAAYVAGQTYFASPTNTATMNSFLAILDEQAGLTASNGMNYFYDSTSSGISANLNQTARYAKFPTAQAFLNGDMLPYTNDGYLWAVSVNYTPTGINELSKYGVALSQNMPNPFNGVSEVNFELTVGSDVVFSVYDITGRVVLENKLGSVTAGKHSVFMNASELGKGVYFYNIKANGASLSKKMIISE
jgi:hypothetical protein